VRPRGLDSEPAQLFVDELLALSRTRATIAPPRGAARTLGRLISFAVGAIGAARTMPKRLAKRLRRLVKRARRALRLRTNLRRALRIWRRALRLLRRAASHLPRPVKDALRRVVGRRASA
jgi:hypothetical protein